MWTRSTDAMLLLLLLLLPSSHYCVLFTNWPISRRDPKIEHVASRKIKKSPTGGIHRTTRRIYIDVLYEKCTAVDGPNSNRQQMRAQYYVINLVYYVRLWYKSILIKRLENINILYYYDLYYILRFISLTDCVLRRSLLNGSRLRIAYV